MRRRAQRAAARACRGVARARRAGVRGACAWRAGMALALAAARGAAALLRVRDVD